MKFFEYNERMNYVHKLIQTEQTGTYKEFAAKLGLKKTQMYEILDELRDYGAEIHFDRLRRSYIFDNEFEIKIDICIIVKGKEKKFYSKKY